MICNQWGWLHQRCANFMHTIVDRIRCVWLVRNAWGYTWGCSFIWDFGRWMDVLSCRSPCGSLSTHQSLLSLRKVRTYVRYRSQETYHMYTPDMEMLCSKHMHGAHTHTHTHTMHMHTHASTSDSRSNVLWLPLVCSVCVMRLVVHMSRASWPLCVQAVVQWQSVVSTSKVSTWAVVVCS